MKEQKLLNEVFDYITGDSTEYSTCQITDKLIDIKLALYRLEKLETPPTENEIKVGEKYTANGNEWKVIVIDEESLYIKTGNTVLKINNEDKIIFTYIDTNDGGLYPNNYTFSFDEIKMVNEIIKEIKKWLK